MKKTPCHSWRGVLPQILHREYKGAMHRISGLLVHDGGGGKIVTFTLAASDNTAFTLKVEGARWTNKSGTPLTEAMTGDFAEILSEVIRQNELTGTISEWEFDSVAQTFTATADPTFSGSVKFQEPIYGVRVTDGGHSDTYVGKPTEGLSLD
jgi:hypothetical protein